jgi:hypothetical protein
VLPPVNGKGRTIVREDVVAFCHRQSAKMLEYAKNSADPELKVQFRQMSVHWLKAANGDSAALATQKPLMPEPRLT